MTTTKRTIFKINNKVVFEEKRDLFLNEVDEIKWNIMKLFACRLADIEVEVKETHQELSNIDVTSEGLINFDAPYPIVLTGLTPSVNPNENVFLDAMNQGDITDYINFI